MLMHDWLLLGLAVDWTAGTARLDLRSSTGAKAITAIGLKRAVLPRELPWGPSSSVNGCRGPLPGEDGSTRLVIEMQSGDEIELVADQFEMPPED
jgi:hypothetical protein